ncbi:hypothetical protein CYMTET_20733 [Cymbomonas tetramitiformis]|uniref:Uncharacterized protein n=1 Tax=Cymbomonas tetramitiformis TaxID=36881 RepID=A0AAE0L3X2_9CHLO|nr:hypothetical protein CYMTET_20733 [Cymbomonas tetramitiformis]
MSCPNIVSLDGTKLMGNGFLSGEAPPPPLERMDACFGSTRPGDSAAFHELREEHAALEAVVRCFGEADAANAGLTGSRMECEQVVDTVGPELQRVGEELERIDAMLKESLQEGEDEIEEESNNADKPTSGNEENMPGHGNNEHLPPGKRGAHKTKNPGEQGEDHRRSKRRRRSK